MIYLCTASSGAVRDALDERLIGCMNTEGQGYAPNRFDNWTWGADNECFTLAERFKLEKYLRWLQRFTPQARANCLFATAPDVVGSAEATIERSLPVLPLLRDIGYPAGLVAQEGIEDLDIPWDEFDALFIGGQQFTRGRKPGLAGQTKGFHGGAGGKEWKLGPVVRGLVADAKERGKHVHIGRINSYRRLERCVEMGADSVDGTYVAFAPEQNLPKVLRWQRGAANVKAQERLF